MGTTKEVFSKLDLPLNGVEYLEFPEPKPDEDLKTYAERMAEPIKDSDENILVGLSMGGFVAQEITQFKKIKKIILISSISHNSGWRANMRWVQKIIPIKIVPAQFLKKSVEILLPLAVHSKNLPLDFVKMAQQFSPEYFKFAIVQLAKWNEKEISVPIVQIVGDKDEYFHFDQKEGNYLVKGGRHLMVATHAKEISNFLKMEL